VTVGSTGYVVVPIDHKKSGLKYDQWMRLDKVSGVQVFGSLEDAERYEKESKPNAKKEGEPAIAPEPAR
jgi:hypothetical protein